MKMNIFIVNIKRNIILFFYLMEHCAMLQTDRANFLKCIICCEFSKSRLQAICALACHYGI